MLNAEDLKKLSNNDLKNRLKKPRNAYSEDILTINECLLRLMKEKPVKVEEAKKTVKKDK